MIPRDDKLDRSQNYKTLLYLFIYHMNIQNFAGCAKCKKIVNGLLDLQTASTAIMPVNHRHLQLRYNKI